MSHRTTAASFTLALFAVACASLTPGGKAVKVYEGNVASADAPAPALPTGCRRVGSSGPIDQQQQARDQSDPYLVQRNETAAAGGNVLLVKSYRFMNLMKTDCSVGDTSPGCMNQSQNWYKVTFESYACDAPALDALAKAPVPATPSIFGFEIKKSAPASASSAAPSTASAVADPSPVPAVVAAPPRAGGAELKSKIVALMHEGVGTDVIVAYVRANRPAAPLSAEEIIEWKKAGISDDVIRATFSN
jgi:hypothetical protein